MDTTPGAATRFAVYSGMPPRGKWAEHAAGLGATPPHQFAGACPPALPPPLEHVAPLECRRLYPCNIVSQQPPRAGQTTKTATLVLILEPSA